MVEDQTSYHPRWLITSGVALAGVVGLSLTEFGIFVPVGLLAAWYVWWSFPRTPIALGTIILLNASVVEQSKGISPLEVGVGVYMYAFLAFWFFRKWFLAREPIGTRPAHWFLFAFFGVCIVSVVFLLATGASPEYWFRDLLTLAILLLAFPLAEAMRSDRGTRVVLAAIAMFLLGLAAYNLVEYRLATLAINYFWELRGGRVSFGSTLYVALAVGAISLHIHMKGWRSRWLALLAGIVGILALGTTFFRGAWLGAILALLVLFVMVERPRKARFVFTAGVATALLAMTIFLVMGERASQIIEAFLARFTSSGEAIRDISIANRIAEAQTVLALVRESPVIGHGYGVFFHYFNIIDKWTEVVQYVHNVYLFLLLKVGVIGFFLFGAYFILTLVDGVRVSRKGLSDPVKLALVRATVALFVGFLFIGTSTGLLQDKQPVLIMMLGTGIVSSCRIE